MSGSAPLSADRPLVTVLGGRAGAVAAFCLITSLYVVAVLLTLLMGNPGWLLFAFAMYTFPALGVLIAFRRPRNSIAWLCLAIGFVWGLVAVTEPLLAYERIHPGFLRRPDLVLAVTGPLWVPGVGLIGTFLVLLFPDGRLPSARWRPLAWLSALTMVLVSTGMLLGPANYADHGFPNLENPLGVKGLDSFAGLFFVPIALIPVCIVASAVALLVRYRRARGIERLQLKWLVAAGAVTALTYVLVMAASLPFELIGRTFPTWLESLQNVTMFPFALIPVSIGIAVLRYRLYAIDRLISRTVSYAVVVGVLAAVYAGVVFLLRGLLPVQGDLAVAASTLVVAALFNPLRRGVQQRVDRRFNRPRYDAELEVERFAGRLRTHLDLDELTGDLLGVVVKTVQPSMASLWIQGDR